MDKKLSPWRLRELKLRRRRFSILEDWYGTEHARSEMAAHTGLPAVIGEAVDELLNNLNIREVDCFARIDSGWANIAGSPLCRLAKPAQLYGSTLYLEVRHSALISELKPSLDLIRQKINQTLGEDAISDIRLTIAGGRL